MSDRIYRNHWRLFLIFIVEIAISSFLALEALASIPASQRQTMSPKKGEIAKYIPPKGLGAPPTTGGGTRGDKCEQDREISDLPLTALMPALTSETSPNLGLTVKSHPDFLAYVPKTSARSAEFVIKDENEVDVYRTNFSISGESGIVIFSLPKNSVALEEGKNYHWYFSLFCVPDNRRKAITVHSWSRRVELAEKLAQSLEKAAPLDRANLYAEAGIWHEAIATLAQLRKEEPNNLELATEWKKLLESAGLQQFADLPIKFSEIAGVP